jgi:hypothetical protein
MPPGYPARARSPPGRTVPGQVHSWIPGPGSAGAARMTAGDLRADGGPASRGRAPGTDARPRCRAGPGRAGLRERRPVGTGTRISLYGHIDTAQAYGNEASVGRALREAGVPREELFITRVSPRPCGSGGRGRTEPAAAGRGPGGLGPGPLARRRPGPGLAQDGAGGRARAGAFRGRVPLHRERSRRGDSGRLDPARRQPGPVQPVVLPAALAQGVPPQRCPGGGLRSRGPASIWTSRLCGRLPSG